MDHPRVKITRDAVTTIAALFSEEDDDQLKLDTLEGETDLFEFTSRLLARIEYEDGIIANLQHQIALREIRIARAANRITKIKELIISLMQSAKQTKLPLAEATVWISERPPTWRLVDVNALPPHYRKKVTIVTFKPDKDKINAAFEKGTVLEGTTKTNGLTVLNVRRN